MQIQGALALVTGANGGIGQYYIGSSVLKELMIN